MNGPAVQKFITVHRNNGQLQSSAFPSCSATTPWLTHLGVPVLIQVINTGDAASITIWIVHVTNIPGSISRIASNHGLKDTDHKIINSTRCLPFSFNLLSILPPPVWLSIFQMINPKPRAGITWRCLCTNIFHRTAQPVWNSKLEKKYPS